MGGADRLGKPVAVGMRLLPAGFAALGLLTIGALVIVGGRALSPPSFKQTPVGNVDVSVPSLEPSAAPPLPEEPEPTVSKSRSIKPLVVAPPPLDGMELERIAPRKPLSDLSLAEPPKPKLTGDWKGTLLFRPFAASAGMIAAQRYSVTIAGIDLVRSDETCLDNSKSWACGAHALGAFRAFLRGLAVVRHPARQESRRLQRTLPVGQEGYRRMAGRKRLGARSQRRPL
jgi:endonuclease YncB( thermonuclease family)